MQSVGVQLMVVAGQTPTICTSKKRYHQLIKSTNATTNNNFRHLSSKCNSEKPASMEAGIAKVAEDSDFYMLKHLVDENHNWTLEYDKEDEIRVWTRSTPNCSFKMVKIQCVFQNVNASTMFDVLHDPDYRKDWDEHMLSSIEIGYLNPNNDIGYYALSCPPPVKNRDFVLQRSWLDTGDEKLILNHSVEHRNYPQRKGFIRAISHLTGFVVRTLGPKDCFLGYVSQTDPRGQLPSWLVNRITHKFAPKVVKRLKKAAEGYANWKGAQADPLFKPWLYAELTLLSPRIAQSECVVNGTSTITEDEYKYSSGDK